MRYISLRFTYLLTYLLTSGLGGHIATSGYPSMSHLFVDIFFESGLSKTLFTALELQ